jgi:hypothetical protein
MRFTNQLQCFSIFRISTFCTSHDKHDLSLCEDIENYFVPVANIRNFSIIAHVDHGKIKCNEHLLMLMIFQFKILGKSTLADRLLESTGAKKQNSGTNQVSFLCYNFCLMLFLNTFQSFFQGRFSTL